MCRSFFTLCLVAVICCFTSHIIAQTDTNQDIPACGTSCPCRCNLTENVLDCSTEITDLIGLGKIKEGECGSIANFTTFDFSYNNLATFSNFDIHFRVPLPSYPDCTLDLSHNKLTHVHNVTFYDCRSIDVDISGNDLTNLDSLSFFLHGSNTLIVKLNLSHNEIQSLGQFVFFTKPNIGSYFSVDLSFNRIIQLNSASYSFLVFNGNVRFDNVELGLQGNLISSVETYPNNVSNRGTVSLDLRHNRLSSLPPVAGTSDSLLQLYLEGNPWNCDCHQRWIADNTSALRQILTSQNSSPPNCQYPDHVMERPLLSLTSAEFICPPEVDQDATLDVILSVGSTQELSCPIGGGDPPIETIEWKIWLKKDLPNSFLLVSNCGNCSIMLTNVTDSWEGLYECTAFNGIEVSINVNVSLRQNLRLADRGRGSFWPIIILLLLLIAVSAGLIFVSFKHYVPRRGSDWPNITGDNGSLMPSLRGMLSTLRGSVRQSSQRGNIEMTTNGEEMRDADDVAYENRRLHPNVNRSVTERVEETAEDNVPYYNETCQETTGPNVPYYNIARSTDQSEFANNDNLNDDDYEDTNNDGYIQLAQNNDNQDPYQGLIF